MFADNDVVSDLHEIVDLGAFLDPGSPEPRPVDSRVRANFNVVINLHDAELGHFFVTSFGRFETKTIGPDNCAAVYDDTCTDAGPLPNGDARIDERFFANDCFVANVASGADHSVVADDRTGFDDHVRLN